MRLFALNPKTVSQSTLRKVGFFEFLRGLIRFLFTMVPVFIRYSKKIKINESTEKDSIGRYLERNAIQYAEKPALIFEDRSWSFREYNEEVNRLANTLISLGIKKGDVFVVCMSNRPEMLFSLGAAAKIGAIASMINFNLRGKALQHCITISPFKAIIVGEELVEVFEEIKTDLPNLEEIPLLIMADGDLKQIPEGYGDLKEKMATASFENPATTTDVTIHDPFAYVFTSGTTGLPKAAYQYHRSWIKTGYSVGKMMFRLTPRDRFYVALPFFHTNPVKLGWGASHVCGSAIVMVRKFSTRRFWDDVRNYQVTAMNYVGELCSYLANQPEKADDANHTLRAMIGNGMRPEVQRVFKDRFKVKKLIELYGASEFDLGFTNLLEIEGSVGVNLTTPFALVKYDVENDELVRDENDFLVRVNKGEPGILLGEARNSIDITGYTDKDATEKKMINDAFEKGDRWFNTGDMLRNIGYGHHEFADRTGDTFRWKGENVSTMEVEKVANSFEQVEQSSAYGIKFGDGDGQIGMLSVLPRGPLKQFDTTQLGRLLVKSLPAYAVPRFLRLKTGFETTPTFKIKKNLLREEGVDLEKTTDPLFVILPGDETYRPLTKQMVTEIKEGKFRF